MKNEWGTGEEMGGGELKVVVERGNGRELDKQLCEESVGTQRIKFVFKQKLINTYIQTNMQIKKLYNMIINNFLKQEKSPHLLKEKYRFFF